MFCTDCGTKLLQDASFCQNCGSKCLGGANGNFDNNSSNQNFNNTAPVVITVPVETKSDGNAIAGFFQGIIGLFIFLVLIVTFTMASNSEDSLGVSSSYMTQYSSSTTVGAAFTKFFANPEWSNYEENGVEFVKFTGICMYNNRETEVVILFKMNADDTFDIYTLSLGIINWVPSDIVSIIYINSFMETVYSGG